MYIGDTDDGSGLHHMVYEVVDNAIDEALAGVCDKVEVTLNKDGSVSITDNGRGIPVAIHEEEGVSAAEVIMTHLHAGGKFDQSSYKVSGGLHGVGVSVVNALSSWLELTIWRDNAEWNMRFEKGVPVAPLSRVKDILNFETGSKVTFQASSDIFSKIKFDFSKLEYRLRELAFLNAGVTLVLTDSRYEKSKSVTMCYDGGLVAFINHIQSPKSVSLLDEPILINGELGDVQLELAMLWSNNYKEHMLCFTNTIPQHDGGTHLSGVRSALTKTLNKYIPNGKKDKIALTGEDMREGLVCVLSVMVPDPKFSSQTKDKLVSSEVRAAVEDLVINKFTVWCEENPGETHKIITKALEAATAREAAKKARAAIRRYWQNREKSNLPKVKQYNTSLWISLPDIPGKLGEVTTLIGENNLNISSVEMNEKTKDYINFTFNIIINDLKNFTNFISELKQKELKFKIIRHEDKKIKKYAFTKKIFKYFKKN